MMRQLILIFTLFGNTGHAATDLPQLLSQFDAYWNPYIEKMGIAQSLENPMEMISTEEELNFTECKTLADQLSASYLRSPFEFKFLGGQFNLELCGKNAKHSFSNQILKTREVLASYIFNRQITLNANNQITYWKELWVSRKDENQKFYYEAMVDEESNIFAHYWNNEVTDTRRKIQGPYHKTVYISGLGHTPEPWSLLTHTDKVEPNNNRKLYRMSLPTQVDWTSVFLPLSFFKMGSVYQYGETWVRNPKNFSSIRIFEFQNQRQCIIGSETIEEKTALIPADYSAYTKCALQ